MYVGPIYDFFYKPKEWLLQQPKFEQKNKNYININGRIFKFNELTGEMVLCNKIPKQINFPKDSNKLKKHKSKKKLHFNVNNHGNHSNKFLTKNNILSPNKTNYKELSSKTHNSNEKESKLDNNKKFLTTSYNNKKKFTEPIRINNNKNVFNNKSVETNIYSKIFNISNSNTNSLKVIKQYNSIQNESNKESKTILYFNKKNRKYLKPSIAFGHKILKPLSTEKNDIKKIKSKKQFKNINNQNILYLMYMQHNNNLTGEGTMNDKIYENNNDDNFIFKSFRDQIFKERIANNLKKKYNFYEDENEAGLKVPHLTHKNFNFYRGYSFSDKRARVPIHQKLFFQYLKNKRPKEKDDLF